MATDAPVERMRRRVAIPLATLWAIYLAAVWVSQQRFEQVVSPLGVIPVVLTGILFGPRKGLAAAAALVVATFAIHVVHGADLTLAQEFRQNTLRWIIGLALGYGSGALADLWRRERGHARDLARHEQELARNNQRLAGILDSQEALIVRVDSKNRITYMNGAYERAFGLKVGETFWVRVHPDDEARTKAAMEQLQVPPYRCALEQRCDMHGQWRWIYWQDSVVRDADGSVVETQGVGFDITERKQAHLKVEQSEERFRLAAKATRDVIWDLEVATGKLSWGGAMEEAFGYPLNDLASDLSSWEERIHPEDRQRTSASFSNSVAAGDAQWQAEYRFRRADGSYARVLDRGFIVRDGDGNVARAVGAMVDITQQREAEDRAREAERLREAARFKTQFLNNAAHELATPLTPLKLQLASLRATLGSQDRKAFDLLERNVDRLGRLVEDLLDAARMEAGRLRLHPSDVALSELAARVSTSFEPQAQKAGVALRLHAETPVEAVCDEGRIEQVLFNLLHNALKFTPAGGAIDLHVRSEGASALLEVVDTGIGMEPEQMTRLFQPFAQVHEPARLRVGGTGLGLYVARGIAQQHGGDLTAASAGADRGSRFTLRLPLEGPPPPSFSPTPLNPRAP